MSKKSKISECEPGQHGYAHWSGQPVTPDAHGDVKLVPQSLYDSWEAYCSCGEWKGIASLYEFSRDDAIAALKAAHAQHAGKEEA